MIKPTIGRVVHFFPATSDALYSNGEPLAATIVRVWSDTCVNLALFDGDAHLHRRTSVLLHQEENERPSSGFAAWPAREGLALKAKADTPPIPDTLLEQHIRESGAGIVRGDLHADLGFEIRSADTG